MSPWLLSSACLSLAVMFAARQSELVQPAPQSARVPILPDNPKYDLAQTRIDWVEGLEAALGRGRPILLFQLLGKFDDAFC